MDADKDSGQSRSPIPRLEPRPVLLRLWRVPNPDGTQWCATIKNIPAPQAGPRSPIRLPAPWDKNQAKSAH